MVEAAGELEACEAGGGVTGDFEMREAAVEWARTEDFGGGEGEGEGEGQVAAEEGFAGVLVGV